MLDALAVLRDLRTTHSGFARRPVLLVLTHLDTLLDRWGPEALARFCDVFPDFKGGADGWLMFTLTHAAGSVDDTDAVVERVKVAFSQVVEETYRTDSKPDLSEDEEFGVANIPSDDQSAVAKALTRAPSGILGIVALNVCDLKTPTQLEELVCNSMLETQL